jgi:hypothetical protein
VIAARPIRKCPDWIVSQRNSWILEVITKPWTRTVVSL